MLLRKNTLLFKAFYLFTVLLFLNACESDDNDPEQLGSAFFIVSLSDKHTIPQVTATGSGSAALILNRDSGGLSGSVSLNSLTGDASAVHIHQGIAGDTGAVVVTLEQDLANTNLFNIPSSTTLSSSEITSILNSEFYINVHTTTNPSGEIRGQIVNDNDKIIFNSLNGDNQVPSPVATSNSALSFITVNMSSGLIRGVILTSGLDAANAVHIHDGFAGETGDPVTSLVKDDSIWRIDDNITLDSSQLTKLLAGGMYLNIHTSSFANGEVRGQIAAENITISRDLLDGSQSVPAVITSATGIAYTTYNTTDNNLNANIRTSNLAATSAHIHAGAVGNTGAVVSTFIQDSIDTDFWSVSDMLSGTDIDDYLSGNLYFNVHSTANQNGEIRSQINP